MSWSQRLSQLSGRWSPFARSPTTADGAQVKDGDFSYITAEDLKNGDYDRSPDGPPRDTDVLKLKDKRGVSYSVHFPAYSIDRGELKVGALRESAAKKLGVDAQRIRLLHKGKKLVDDSRSCREEGLREGAELMCVTSEAEAADAAAAQAADNSSGDSGEEDGEEGDAAAGPTKRKRVRHKKKKKGGRKKAVDATDSDLPGSGTASPRPPIPVTPLEKLNAAGQTLQGLQAQCVEFRKNPPAEPAKREFEHKRLSETILTQVLLKLDAVETDELEARARRKELVKQAQQVLNDLDAAKDS